MSFQIRMLSLCCRFQPYPETVCKKSLKRDNQSDLEYVEHVEVYHNGSSQQRVQEREPGFKPPNFHLGDAAWHELCNYLKRFSLEEGPDVFQIYSHKVGLE